MHLILFDFYFKNFEKKKNLNLKKIPNKYLFYVLARYLDLVKKIIESAI